MGVSDDDLQAFSKAYTSGAKRSLIAVDDRNREFRASVAAFVAKNPGASPTELIEDLVEEEAMWCCGHDIGFAPFAILVSELLMRGGTRGASLLRRVAGRHMDLDGTLMYGGLSLTAIRREELLEELREVTSKADPRLAIVETALRNATIRPERIDHDM